MTILQDAFGANDLEDGPDVRSIIGAVVLAANPLSPSSITALLGFEAEDVFPLLSSVHSLLVLHEDFNRPVRPFHKTSSWIRTGAPIRGFMSVLPTNMQNFWSAVLS